MSKMTDTQKRLVFEMNAARAEYLVIGGMAMRAHGIKRATEDLDLLIGPTMENACALNPIFLRRFKFPEEHVAANLIRPGIMLRDKGIDILSSIEGFDFDGAYRRATWINLDGCRLRVPAVQDLITAKRASLASGNDEAAHVRDQEDILVLEAMLE